MHSSALLNFVRVQFPGCILIISSRVSYHISIEPKNETSIYSQCHVFPHCFQLRILKISSCERMHGSFIVYFACRLY